VPEYIPVENCPEPEIQGAELYIFTQAVEKKSRIKAL